MGIFNDQKELKPKPKNEKLAAKNTQSSIQEEGLRFDGIDGDRVAEDIPNFINAPCEKVISHGNSWIVMGRDRPASRASGGQGSGATKCSSIDFVVGRHGTSDQYVDNNHKVDAARLTIAQRTDPDKNFEIADGSFEAKQVSSVSMKADAVRVIARQHIKLVTGPFPEENKKVSRVGIDLIAGNDGESLQPMVLGDNLIDCLKAMAQDIVNISAMLDQLATAQTKLESSIQNHTHKASLGNMGLPLGIIPDIEIIFSNAQKTIQQQSKITAPMFTHRNNITYSSINFLEKNGFKTILSRYNKVN